MFRSSYFDQIRSKFPHASFFKTVVQCKTNIDTGVVFRKLTKTNCNDNELQTEDVTQSFNNFKLPQTCDKKNNFI